MELKKMTIEIHCEECNKTVESIRDEEHGESHCPVCGLVLSENEQEEAHAGYLAEGSNHGARNRTLANGQKVLGGTGPKKWEAHKFGKASVRLFYTARNNANRDEKKHARALLVHEEVESYQLGEYVNECASAVIQAGWVEQPDEKDSGMAKKLGKLPRNELRFMQGKPQDYQMGVAAVAVLMVTSDLCPVEGFDWKAKAKELGLKSNDLLKAKKAIKGRISRLMALGRFHVLKAVLRDVRMSTTSNTTYHTHVDSTDAALTQRAVNLDAEVKRLGEWARQEMPQHSRYIVNGVEAYLSRIGEPGTATNYSNMPASMLITTLGRIAVAQPGVYGKYASLAEHMGHSDGGATNRLPELLSDLGLASVGVTGEE